MIVSLPMYDRPEVQAANDRFYDLIRAHLPDAPETLSRDGYHWTDPDLLLSQTCSLPYRTGLQEHVSIIATPVHDLPCPAGTYFSVVVVREDDPREDIKAFQDSHLAINGPVSQSGWAAIDELAAENGITFGSITASGGHGPSARAVAEGKADLAAIDAVTWGMIERYDSFASGLRVLCQTRDTPALPYITAIGRDPAPIQEALIRAVDALSPEDQKTLCLIDLTHIPAEYYSSLHIPPAPMLNEPCK